MGPEAIRETLSDEGFSPPAIEHGLKQLSLSSNINDPLRYARKVAEGYKAPGRPMGCVACRDGWLLNSDTGDQFFPDPPHQDRVRPCRTCRPHHYERGDT